jgi:hypothetical protein
MNLWTYLHLVEFLRQAEHAHLVPTNKVCSVLRQGEESIGHVWPPRQQVCEPPGQSHLNPPKDTADLALTLGVEFACFIKEARESQVDVLVGLGFLYLASNILTQSVNTPEIQLSHFSKPGV